MEQENRQLVTDEVAGSAWHMATLRAVADLQLPDWAVGAGFVRNAVWDRLHGFEHQTPLGDIDVLFFDAEDISRAREQDLEAALTGALPDRPWSVRNQARMHLRNGDRPYRSTEDAMSFWLETPTCVAVRSDLRGQVEIIAPFGLRDLVEMRAMPTVAGRRKPDQYRARMAAKNWPGTWPGVRVELTPPPEA